ncbi:MAG: TlpA family protein disulfide reductase [Phycisphaerales bacterium]|nr:TlpA family protein disulfide reductase [Phycisphaerales bacterium]
MLSFPAAMSAAIVTVLTFSGVTWAQVNDDAKAALNESAKALAALKSATFRGHKFIEATDPRVQNMKWDVQGSVKILKGTPNGHMIDGKTSVAGFEEAFKVAEIDGVATWVDTGNKKIVQAQSSSREGSNALMTAQQVMPEEFYSAEPFKRAMENTESLTIEGSEEIGGIPCTKIHAVYKGGRGQMTIHLSQKDKLPRRIATTAGQKDDVVTMIQEVTELKIDAGLSAADLAIATPEGYSLEIVPAKTADAPKVDPNQANPSEPTPPTPPAPPVQLGVAKGEVAPPFTLADGTGNQVSLDRLKGNVVVLEFFATTMGAAKRASPEVQKIAEEFKDQSVKVYGVACRERKDGEAAQYQKDLGLTYGLLLKGDEVAKQYQVKGFPSFAVIGADGKMVEFIQGTSTQGWQEKLATAVRTAAAAK